MPPVVPTPVVDSTNTSTYLDRSFEGKTYYSDGVESAIGTTTIVTIGLSIVTGAPGALSGLSIHQCQIPQMLSMFNTNVPDNYVEYWQAFSISKLDFNIAGSSDPQSSLADQTRRNLDTKGYKSLSNVKFYNQSFLVNYIYWFMVLGIFIILHIITIVCSILFSKSKNSSLLKRFFVILRDVFEFHVYFKFLVYSSMFIFLVIVNEIAAANFDTNFNIFSFSLSMFVLAMLILFTVVPIPFLMRNRKQDLDLTNEIQDKVANIIKRTWKHKIWNTTTSGLKDSVFGCIHYQLFLVKCLCYAIILIILSNAKIQISLFILTTALFLAYLIVIRPFKILIHSIVAILNEIVVIIAILLMTPFIDSDSQKETLSRVIIWVITANIIVCFLLSLCYQIYHLFKRCRHKRNSLPNGEGRIVTNRNINEIETPTTNLNLQVIFDDIRNPSGEYLINLFNIS